MQGEGSSSQDQKKIQQIEWAQNDLVLPGGSGGGSVLPRAQNEVLAMAFQSVQKYRVAKMEENLSLQSWLKVARITIEELKKNRNDYSDKIKRLQSKLSLVKAYVGAANTQLRHVKCKAYGIMFKECKSLAVQILPMVEAHLLQILIVAKAIASL